MSVQAMAAVFDADLSATQKLVLLAIADCCGHENTAWPSQTTLAAKTGLTRRAVQMTTHGLETLGVLEHTTDRDNRPMWRLLLPGLEVLPLPKGTKGLDRNRRKELLSLLLERAGPRCAYCNRVGTHTLDPDGAAWHIDRVTPGKRKGTYTLENVVLACRFCNCSKRDRGEPSSPPRAKVIHPQGEGDSPPSKSSSEPSVGRSSEQDLPRDPGITIPLNRACPHPGCAIGAPCWAHEPEAWNDRWRLGRRDALWEALALSMPGPGSRSERGRWNRAVADLREADASPVEVLARVVEYRRRWPKIDLTPTGLAGNWGLLAQPKPGSVTAALRQVQARRAQIGDTP